MNSEKPRNLEIALKRLTESINSPCVPGELEGWARTVREAVDLAAPLVRQHIARNHGAHFAGILEEDAEMYRHVFQLKQADQKLLQEFEALAVRSKKLAVTALQVGPDEARLRDDVAALTQTGLAFVLEWQKQEIALRSWLQEAFTRERGTAD